MQNQIDTGAVKPEQKSALKYVTLTAVCATSGAKTLAIVAPSRGALITSFTVAGRELLYLDETTLLDPTKNVRGGIPVLFPAPGKLRDDVWRYGDHSGVMKQHGFARTEAWQCIEQRDDRLLCALESNERTLTQYPWRFKAELEFSLRAACLRITFRLTNTDTQTMPFGVGYHPYFQVADKAKAHIDTDATQAFDNTTKITGPFSGFDLTQTEVDIHLLNQSRSTSALQLGNGESIQLRASPEFSLWVMWTLAGKDFVCLEPWTSPGNAINTRERLLTLAPEQRHESWIEIELND